MTRESIGPCIIISILIVIAVEAVLNARRNRKAFRRLRRIAHLINLSDGHENAGDLYREAVALMRSSNVMPEDIGFDDFDGLHAAAVSSLKRATLRLDALYADAYQECRAFENELNSRPAGVEIAIEYSSLNRAVSRLGAHIDTLIASLKSLQAEAPVVVSLEESTDASQARPQAT